MDAVNERNSNHISNEAVVVLEEYWENGLRSYGTVENRQKVLEVVRKTGLPAKKIKSWIHNKRIREARQRSGRSKAPSLKPRKKSAYSCFMAEYMANEGTSQNKAALLKQANQSWANIKRKKGTKKYEELAAKQNTGNPPPLNEEQKKVMKKRIANEVKNLCVKAHDMDCEAFFVMVDSLGNITTTGTQSGLAFFEKQNELLTRFGFSIVGNSADLGKPSRDSLRKRVQEIFNKKYCEATGVSKMSYRKLVAGKIRMEGLPDGVECKRPTSYGISDLEAIVQHQDNISVCVMNNSTCTSSDLTQPTGSETLHTEESSQEPMEVEGDQVAEGSDQNGAEESEQGAREVLENIYRNLTTAGKEGPQDKHENESSYYPVEKVLKKRMKGGKRQFLVKWTGYSSKYNEWVDESSVTKEAVDVFLKKRSKVGK